MKIDILADELSGLDIKVLGGSQGRSQHCAHLCHCCCATATELGFRTHAHVQAPPGAGKTTTVPLALLAHSPAYLRPDASSTGSTRGSSGVGGPGAAPKKILVLEPRRVAAKSAARRMASLMGEKVRYW